MAKSKKTQELTLEEKLEQALAPESEQPYPVPENWVWTRFYSVLDYEQPGEYIVESTEYSDSFSTPVLTAGKSFILGYTDEMHGVCQNIPVIIFDDFTTDTKYVDFPFKVKSSAMKILQPTTRIGIKFIYYYMQTVDCDHANHRRFWISTYSHLPFPLPPLPEQQRITAVIESLFSKLDTAKEIVQYALDSFETRKAAILHKAFTGELTTKWRATHGNIKNTVINDILDYSKQLPNKAREAIKEFQNAVNEVAVDETHIWHSCSIGSIAVVTNGSTPSRKVDDYWNGKIPWVSSGEVRNNLIDSTRERITQLGFENTSVKMLPKGTVLIAMIGEGKTRGQSAVLNINATTNQNVAAINIEHGFISPHFLWYWLQKEYSNNREKGNGTGPQALNCQRVRELRFIVPSFPEQQEIVRILDSLLESESKAKELCDTIEKIDLMKKSILARAFRGELGTNDPSEESAVELLREMVGE